MAAASPADLFGVSDKLFERLVAFRRDLHQYPELSNVEGRTASRIVSELDRLGIHYRTGIAGTGIVAEIPGASGGPVVALRADMDALPIQEQTGLPFASKRDGVMHACGHDVHSTMLLGAAELLMAADPPPVPVRLMWQPGEERGNGAQAMIAEGALDGCGMIFGGHVDRHYPPGALVVTEGAVNASADSFQIDILGKGGHGARPHEALDAVVVGSLMVMAIQTIVSREVDPANPSVISVGAFHAGTARNVIAGTARLEGTIRAQTADVREALNTGIERIARSVAQLHGANVEVTMSRGTPALSNTPVMADLARRAALDVVDPDHVMTLHTTNMGGEDFAFFLEQIPGCYIRFGSAVSGKEGFPAHSSGFEVDERSIAAGATWFANVARTAGREMARHGRPAAETRA